MGGMAIIVREPTTSDHFCPCNVIVNITTVSENPIDSLKCIFGPASFT